MRAEEIKCSRCVTKMIMGRLLRERRLQQFKTEARVDIRVVYIVLVAQNFG